MPQSYSQTVRNEFNKGLVTEFSELRFPDNASIDELNCSLHKAGNRSRRLGLTNQSGGAVSSEVYNDTQIVQTGKWVGVAGDASIDFCVVQVGKYLRFYQYDDGALGNSEVPISDSDANPYILDMTTYEVGTGEGAGASRVEVASVEGALVVASPQVRTFFIKRSKDDGSFSHNNIKFRVRDFRTYSNPDLLLVKDPPPSSTAKRYDVSNAGWNGDKGEAALSAYKAANSDNMPPLTHPWYSGKDSAGDFDVAEWEKIYAGSTLTTIGHYIIPIRDADRAGIAGLTGTVEMWDGSDIEDAEDWFSTVAAYAGRMWYGGERGNIYFSQILQDITNTSLGKCYQVNDPTSEEISDLLATDGGVIEIPEAVGVRRLHVFGSSILVFAKNGVWRISGVDGNMFDPTDFSVFKITDFGLAIRGSFSGAQNAVPFWWSTVGIHTVQVTDQGGMVEVNLSRETIQSRFDAIGAEERGRVLTGYDAINNRVAWLYPEPSETVDNKLSNVLWLDLDIGAFYPWKVSDHSTLSNHMVGATFFNGSGAGAVDFTVVDSNGDEVQDSNGDTVIVTRTAGNLSSSELIILYLDDNKNLGFAEFTDSTFVDWEDADYDSYAESAYNFMGDLGRRKNSPYITVFMRETETGFNLVNTTYEPLRESSLLVTSYWDFKKATFTAAQECYRRRQPIVVDPDNLNLFNSPSTVLTTRLKLRGRGRVVRLRFEGQPGKDFNLLGYETLDARNGGY